MHLYPGKFDTNNKNSDSIDTHSFRNDYEYEKNGTITLPLKIRYGFLDFNPRGNRAKNIIIIIIIIVV